MSKARASIGMAAMMAFAASAGAGMPNVQQSRNGGGYKYGGSKGVTMTAHNRKEANRRNARRRMAKDSRKRNRGGK